MTDINENLPTKSYDQLLRENGIMLEALKKVMKIRAPIWDIREIAEKALEKINGS